MTRADGRKPRDLRPVRILRRFTKQTPGSVLIEAGDTAVLCTASLQAGVPAWREGSGLGWLTAEYDMLPGSTSSRRPRSRNRLDGRTQEIQRLIGRTLRGVVDMAALAEHMVLVDCDVLQADGGTRTLSITGAYVAVADAVRWAVQRKDLPASCLVDHVAAISAGVVGGRVLLDLNYAEDAAAEVDLNLAMTGRGQILEIQASGEQSTFTRTQLDDMLRWGAAGVRKLIALQKASLRRKR